MISRASAGRALFAAVVVGTGALAALSHLRDAGAQRLDPRRSAVFVVGPPGGASPTIRGDARRTGASKELLPSGVLHVAWKERTGASEALRHRTVTGAVVLVRGLDIILKAAIEA